MAIHTSILAWEIPRAKGSLTGYSPWGHKEMGMIEVTQHACSPVSLCNWCGGMPSFEWSSSHLSAP